MTIDIFNNSNHVPRPKSEIRIERLSAIPYPDGLRVHVEIDVTPFQERPNLLVTLYDDDRQLISELSVIATMHYQMEFTIHLKGVDNPAGDYSVEVELFYETRNPPQDKKQTQLSINPDSTE